MTKSRVRTLSVVPESHFNPMHKAAAKLADSMSCTGFCNVALFLEGLGAGKDLPSLVSKNVKVVGLEHEELSRVHTALILVAEVARAHIFRHARSDPRSFGILQTTRDPAIDLMLNSIDADLAQYPKEALPLISLVYTIDMATREGMLSKQEAERILSLLELPASPDRINEQLRAVLFTLAVERVNPDSLELPILARELSHFLVRDARLLPENLFTDSVISHVDILSGFCLLSPFDLFRHFTRLEARFSLFRDLFMARRIHETDFDGGVLNIGLQHALPSEPLLHVLSRADILVENVFAGGHAFVQ